jgi:predicted phosphodiesterase
MGKENFWSHEDRARLKELLKTNGGRFAAWMEAKFPGRSRMSLLKQAGEFRRHERYGNHHPPVDLSIPANLPLAPEDIPVHWDPVPIPEKVTDPIPADRTFIERQPVSQRKFDPLNLGSNTTERVLLLPDTHAPFHDRKAWECAMKFGRQFRPDTVVHLGDWMDCFTISDHDKDPRRGTQLEDELIVMREIRQEVEALGAQRKICTLGNHEFRLMRYLMRSAPALISMLRIEGLMELTQSGWSVIQYMQHATLGKMHLTHDCGFAGTHAVHNTGNAFASSVVFGHVHRLGAQYFGDVTGQRHVAASLGWLGSMPEAAYEHEAKKMRFWQHGLGTAYLEPNGNFHLQLVPIIDYRCVLDGQIISV